MGILNDPNTHTNQWVRNEERSTITPMEDGTLLEWVTQFSVDTFRTPSATSEYCFTGDTVTEFDVVSITGEVRVQWIDANSNVLETRLYGSTFVPNSHYKFVHQDGVILAYLNDNNPYTIEPTPNPLGSDYCFRFRLPTTSIVSSIKFKNFKIYKA